MSHLTKVDHVTYACAKGTIEKWAWFHIEVEGGTLVTRIDDVRPDDPDSSMKLWCIDYGGFGIALVEGIDRRQKSQVTKFVERHGDHACQHVAFACGDLEAFRRHLVEMGGHPRGTTLVRHDGFGLVKQMFAKGYQEGDAAEASFPEYVQRPQPGDDPEKVRITFSEEAGRGFYDQIEDAIASGDREPLVDFARMPRDWRPPRPAGAERARVEHGRVT
ncbi:MAG TPA: hypothetical protein VF339_02185 [Gammaproteobacteria bacterium]